MQCGSAQRCHNYLSPPVKKHVKQKRFLSVVTATSTELSLFKKKNKETEEDVSSFGPQGKTSEKMRRSRARRLFSFRCWHVLISFLLSISPAHLTPAREAD